MATNVSWKDKILYSQVWMKQIYQITNFMMTSNQGMVFRGIDALIMSLLKRERELVFKRKEELGEPVDGVEKKEQYDKLFMYVVDVLETAGYLSKTSVIGISEVGGFEA